MCLLRYVHICVCTYAVILSELCSSCSCLFGERRLVCEKLPPLPSNFQTTQFVKVELEEGLCSEARSHFPSAKISGCQEKLQEERSGQPELLALLLIPAAIILLGIAGRCYLAKKGLNPMGWLEQRRAAQRQLPNPIVPEDDDCELIQL